MRIFLSFFFIQLLATTAFGQVEKQTTKEIVAKIAEANYYSFGPDGWFTTDPTVQYALAMDLEAVATTDELVKLTEHENGAVRAYAFEALDNRKYPKLLKLAIKHIDDTVKIKVVCGWSPTKNLNVGSFFVNAVNLTPEDRQKLNDILLNRDNKLGYTNDILEDLEPTEKNYKRVRELAKAKNPFAVIALSRYRKQEDIEIIQAQLLINHYSSIEAIEHFPAPEFKATLTELKRQGYCYYGTDFSVAVYQDAFSVDYFNSKLDQLTKEKYRRKEECKYIFEAISKYKNPIYDSLFFRLWEDDQVDSETFNYLLTIDSAKCKTLVIQSLERLDGLENQSFEIAEFLNYLIDADPQVATALIADKIRNQHVFKYNYFPDAAQQIYSDTIVNALLERLSTADNPYIYLPIVEALVSFKQPKVNERMFAEIKVNEGIDGWGEEKMTKFLMSNGLMVH